MIELERTDPSNAEFQALVQVLDSFLAELNGSKHDFYAGHNKLSEDTQIVLARVGTAYVGCGGFRLRGADTVEVKRMFVKAESRGQGAGRAIVEGLENWARELGQTRAILETSRRLESAVRLYQRCGYALIPNYAPYEDVADSVCMSKDL